MTMRKNHVGGILAANGIRPQTEQDVRQIIENQLANAGWEQRLIAREAPLYDDQKKALGKLRPDWMLYHQSRRAPVAVVEAKKPKKGQKNLAAALEQGAAYAAKLQCPVVFASDGDVLMTRHLSNGQPLMIGNVAVSHFLPPWQILKFAAGNVWHRGEGFAESGGLVRLFTSAKKILNKEGIAKMDAFNEFAKLLFVKILTELHDSGDKMFAGIPARWDDFSGFAGEDLKRKYAETLDKLNNKYEGGFPRSPINRPDILEKLVGLVAPRSFIDTEEDVKGRAYEYFLRDYTKGRDELNRYFTPRHIVEAMVKMIKVRPGEKVYDPFCGTGGMLIEAFRRARRLLPPKESAGRKKMLDNLRMKCMYGRDISDAAHIAKMNMVLSGDGHSNITRGDSLSAEAAALSAGKSDIVLTNIPFSEKESQYILHCLNAIRGREGARAAIIVPERVISDPGYGGLRRDILNDFWLERVVSLPKDVFAEYTSAKTSIIIVSFRGASHKKQKHFEFYALHSDGFEGKTRRRPSAHADNDLADMLAGRLPPRIVHPDDNLFLFAPGGVLKVVPKGKCKMAKMGDVIEPLLRPVEITPGDICLEPGFNAREHKVFIKKRKTYAEVAKSGRKRYLIKKGDLVVGMMHLQDGLVAFSDCEDELHSTGTHRAFAVKATADPRYVFWALRELVMKMKKDDTTGRENYNVGDILNLPLPLPPLAEQRKIARAMDMARENIRDAERNLAKAERDFAVAGGMHLPFKITAD